MSTAETMADSVTDRPEREPVGEHSVETDERLSFIKKKRKIIRGKITRSINRARQSIDTGEGTKRRLSKELEDIKSDYSKACELNAEMYFYLDESESDKLDKWEADLSEEVYEIEEEIEDYVLTLTDMKSKASPRRSKRSKESKTKSKTSKVEVESESEEGSESQSRSSECENSDTQSEYDSVRVSKQHETTSSHKHSTSKLKRSGKRSGHQAFDQWINDLVEFEETKILSSNVNISIAEALFKLEASKDVPAVVLTKFNGNPLDYVDFMENFKIHVHDKPHLTDDMRMIQLKMHLTGDAERSVVGLGSRGIMYATTLKTIQQEFGQPSLIARAIVKKLTSGVKIPPNNRNTLREFSLDLIDSIAILKRLDYFSDVDANENLRRIVCRLPHYLIDKWKLQVADLRENGVTPSVLHISDFVRKRVKAEFDPDFGDLEGAKFDAKYNLNVRDNKRPSYNQNRKPVYSQQTVSGNKLKGCYMCKQNHKITECPVFIGCKVADKVQHAKDNWLCFSCLNKGHVSRECRSRKQCGIGGCFRTHHRLLHEDVQVLGSATSVLDFDSMLPVIRVRFRASIGRIREGNVLMDSGASTTVIRKGFAKSLGLQGKKERLDIVVVGGETFQHPQSRRLKFWISNLQEEHEFEIEAYEIQNTVLDNPPINHQWLHTFTHLRDIDFPRANGPVDMILGIQYSHLHAEDEIRQGLPFEPVGKKTKLGWCVIGSNSNQKRPEMCSVNAFEKIDLNKFYDFETMGVQATNCSCPEQTMSNDDRRALQMMKESCVKKGNRYEIGLPWKRDPVELPDNYPLAERRLESLERSLARNDNKAQMYTSAVTEYEAKGWAEIIDPEQAQLFPAYYLPHHGVYRPDKPSTPLRVVFDPASRFSGISLNSFLYTGPNLMGNLLGVLLRFREKEVAIAGDISKMFLQVLLNERDSYTHRFLWRDLMTSKEPSIYRLLRVTFGDKSSPSMASFVMLRIAEDNSELYPEAATILERDRYMDDLIHSCATAEQAIDRIEELDEILGSGSFKIKEWYTSSQEARHHLNQKEHQSSDTNDKAKNSELEEDKSGVEVCLDGEEVKTLGLGWNPVNDKLTFLVKPLTLQRCTKRNILSRLCMLFDPLGLASAVTIKARIAMQDLWRMKHLDWDDDLPDSVYDTWKQLFKEIESLRQIEFPRCLKPPSSLGYSELHVFADASASAYGSVAYLMWPTPEGVEVQLISAKARVAPLRQTTVPRLELMAALTASRLAKTIVNEFQHKPSKVTLWTDSQIVLHWILSDSITLKQFVGVRVAEIQSSWGADVWRFVPSNENPADDLSRGIRVKDMTGRWMHGPQFLTLPLPQWPGKTETEHIDDTSEKRKLKLIGSVKTCEQVILPEKFSSWQRLLRVTAYCLTFIQKLKSKVRHSKTSTECEMVLHPDMIHEAEFFWLKSAQNDLDKWEQRYSDLAPFVENELIRVGGRLRESALPYDQKHPILLPGGHHISKLIMQDCHGKMGHVGPERTLCESRHKFWIMRGRNLAKNIVRCCVVCRKLRQPVHSTLMADLPNERVRTFSPPFSVTGVDLFGPFKLKYGRNKSVKAWGALFTCANVRAIHLEIVSDLSTQTFMQSLRRFAAHHGWPQTIISDNGTSFVGTCKELRKLVVEGRKQLEEFAVLHRVKWMFITPLSPHQGGLYESMIKQTKRALTVAIGQQLLTWGEMATVFAEVECVINSRPLGYLTNDPNDPRPLTPNHFLLGRSTAELPQGPYQESKNLHRRFEFVQSIVHQFWKRFVREYLPTLMKRTKWKLKGRQFQVNDIVLLFELNVPRGKWNLARVIEVYPGNDGVVRNVKVRTQFGEYQRSVQKCCPLLEANSNSSV